MGKVAVKDKKIIVTFSKKNYIAKDEDFVTLNLKNNILKESKYVNLLGIILDNQLSFMQHVLPLCKKANANIYSIFNYSPLIWGFSSRGLLHKINSIHSRANRLLCDRVENECRISIYNTFCRTLLKEVFKTKVNQNPFYMNDVFAFRKTAYSFRASSSHKRRRIRTTNHVLLSVSYIASKCLRNASSLPLFEHGLNNIPCIQCSCRLCATYICNVGYMN